MSVLHIVNNYFYTPIYRQLFDALEKQGVKNRIHVTLNKEHYPKLQEFAKNKDFSFSKAPSSKVLRVLFFPKINRAYRELREVVKRDPPALIHAHTFLSDGVIALRLKKKFNIPYYAVVRYTDLMFLKKYPPARWLMRKIFADAKYVLMVSLGHTDEVLSYLPEGNRYQVSRKLKYFNNGLDPFWLKNLYWSRKLVSDQLKLLFVGDFSKRKNVLTTIKVAKLLKGKSTDVVLKLVGWENSSVTSYMKKVQNACNGFPFIEIIDRETDRQKLLEIYRESDIYIMPSIGETFGLTYAEAMSQGLPVIYTRNQGIDQDKLIENNNIFGYAVDCMDVEEIAEKIELVVENYPALSTNALKYSTNFDWDTIANAMSLNYEDIIHI